MCSFSHGELGGKQKSHMVQSHRRGHMMMQSYCALTLGTELFLTLLYLPGWFDISWVPREEPGVRG